MSYRVRFSVPYLDCVTVWPDWKWRRRGETRKWNLLINQISHRLMRVTTAKPSPVHLPLFHCRDTHIVILLQFHKNSPLQEIPSQNKKKNVTEWMSPFASSVGTVTVDRTGSRQQQTRPHHSIDRPNRKKKFPVHRLVLNIFPPSGLCPLL